MKVKSAITTIVLSWLILQCIGNLFTRDRVITKKTFTVTCKTPNPMAPDNDVVQCVFEAVTDEPKEQ